MHIATIFIIKTTLKEPETYMIELRSSTIINMSL